MPKANTTQVGGDHYITMAIQPEAFIYANKIPFHEGSAIAYLCRWMKKGGRQDLLKAKHVIDLLLAHLDRQETSSPEPDWHNPGGLESPGDGWRFCVKSEDEDPPRTEWWSPRKRLWFNCHQVHGTYLSTNYTYRTKKPLP